MKTPNRGVFDYRYWSAVTLVLAVMAAPIESIAGEADGESAGPERIAGGGGVQLAVYEAGNAEGAPILFLHGFTQNHLSWSKQFSGPLAEEFRLVAIDLRGHGASDKPSDATYYKDPEMWAEDIRAVLEARQLERPVVVGWSYGGFIIADYVRIHGQDKLGGLVFVGAVTDWGTDAAMERMGPEFLEVVGGAFSPDLKTMIDATRAFMRMVTARPMDDETFERVLASAMMVPVAIRNGMAQRHLENDDVLAAIDLPALVIHGAADEIVLPSFGEHIAGVAPGAKLLLYEGVGHAPFLEDAESFDRDLAEFLRSTRR